MEAAYGKVEAALQKLSSDVDERVQQMEAAYGRTVQKLLIDDRAERTEASYKRLEALLQRLDDRIEAMDGRIKKMDGRVEKVEASSKNTEAVLSKLDGHMESMDGRLQRRDSRIERVEIASRNVEAVLQKLDARIERMDGHIKKMDSRAQRVEAATGSAEAVLERVDRRSESMNGHMESTGGRIKSVDGCIEGTQAASESTKELLQELGNRLERLATCTKSAEDKGGSMEAVLHKLRGVEASSGSTEALLRELNSRIKGIDGHIEGLEAASSSAEGVLRDLDFRIRRLDGHMQGVEVTGQNTEAVLQELHSCAKTVERIDSRVERIDDRFEDRIKRGNVEFSWMEAALTSQERLMTAMHQELSEAKVRSQELRTEIVHVSSRDANTAEWDLSGMQFDGKEFFESSPFTLAGVTGLRFRLYPQGCEKATAGHASLYLNGPTNVLVRFRLTLDGTNHTTRSAEDLGKGWRDFCKAGNSFNKASVEVLEVIQRVQGSRMTALQPKQIPTAEAVEWNVSGMIFDQMKPVWRSPMFTLAAVPGWQLVLHTQGSDGTRGKASLWLNFPINAVARIRLTLDGTVHEFGKRHLQQRTGLGGHFWKAGQSFHTVRVELLEFAGLVHGGEHGK